MLRPWDVQIVLDRTASRPAYLQIVHALMDAIKSGRLAPGQALPGTREVAARLDVNRKTVQQAFDELVAQGWLSTELKRGTFVSAALPGYETVAGALPALHTPPRFTPRRTAPALGWTAPPPGTLVFDDGAPDTRLMPAAVVARTWRQCLLAAAEHNRLGYGDPRGLLRLREAVAEMLNADRGLNVSAENICITRGSQMAIWLAARLLAGLGDTVALERLSYPPAREAFAANGATAVHVEMDEHGLVPEALEELCRTQTIRAIYVTPHHHFPTTVTLPPERRIRLLSLAEQYGFVIVEDDYDHEFHFSHRPVLPLASAHSWERLLYIGSLSKLLSPSLRIGYLVGTAEIIARAGAEIMMLDRQGDPVTEATAASLMEEGVLKAHARKTLRVYEARRDTLAEALHRAYAEQVAFTLPQGGLALWVKFAATVGLGAAALAREKVMLTLTKDGARLGFGSLNEAELQEAVARLARAARG